jgi:hypothetical protein
VSVIVAAILGAVVGLGSLVVAAGLRGQALLSTPSSRPTGAVVAAAARALGAALVGYWLTGWPVLGVALGIAAFAAPSVIGTSARHRRELARVEAVASWTEHLRDTIAGANGLEHAIAASGAVAPTALAPEIHRLVGQLGYLPLPVALRTFADDVSHPTCDFVVAGLTVAAQKEARELGSLLTQLAASARGEALMRSRVWAGRARTRTSVRVVGLAVVLFALGLVVFDRAYLEPYSSITGQLVLAIVVVIFAASMVAMDRMGRIRLPERFLARRAAPGAVPEGAP